MQRAKYISVSQSVSGTLNRPRVVAPSKTCGHMRSSMRRWRWSQCRPWSAICCTHVRQGRPRWRFHSGLMSGLPPVRASTARRSAEWAGVSSGSRRTWPKMESRLRQIRIAKPSSPVWLLTEAFVTKYVSANGNNFRFSHISFPRSTIPQITITRSTFLRGHDGVVTNVNVPSPSQDSIN